MIAWLVIRTNATESLAPSGDGVAEVDPQLIETCRHPLSGSAPIDKHDVKHYLVIGSACLKEGSSAEF
jgi:hypothetical protein